MLSGRDRNGLWDEEERDGATELKVDMQYQRSVVFAEIGGQILNRKRRQRPLSKVSRI